MDLRWCTWAQVSSNARRASEPYTPANPSSAQANRATWNMSAPPNPGGHTRMIASSGTKAPSRIVSCDVVARIPIVSHVSSMR